MGYRVTKERMNEILCELAENNHIYAPAWDAPKKRVQYREIRKIEEIVSDRQSDFSPKAAFYPVSQVMFYFHEDRTDDSEIRDDKDILIFARACDIHAARRQDALFCRNGGAEDYYYKRLREKVKYILLECAISFENCFCVSLGTNITEDYALAVSLKEDEIFVNVKDGAFEALFKGEPAADHKVAFVSENKKKLRIPKISRDNLKVVSDLPFWSQYDEKCIACGGCNTVCGTCTCFDTVDIQYTEGSREGERRRVWSGCMLENFTETAGGARSRKTHGANMRFKVFHKFYDYKERFGSVTAEAGDIGHMCVGCGRCDIRCPKEISFFDAVCGIHDEICSMGEKTDE